MAKKRIGISKSFGARYGKTNVDKIDNLMKKRLANKKCPQCLRDSIKRVAMGIWKCSKCEHKFASKAYEI